MTDLVAIVASALGALSLTWAWVEVTGYLRRRRGRGPRAPGYGRMRLAIYAALVTMGGVLGMAIAAWAGG